MNVKLKKRKTKSFATVNRGETFLYDDTVYMGIDGVDTSDYRVYNAVDLTHGDLRWINGETEVEVIHGAFVEDGAE